METGPEYLIEESVLDVTMSRHLPALAWRIFDKGPLVRRAGTHDRIDGRDGILFDFPEHDFQLFLPPHTVTELGEKAP